MARTKNLSNKKKQLGQFITPPGLAQSMIEDIEFKITDTILEPCFGNGSFIIPIAKKLLKLYPDDISTQDKMDLILQNNLFGCEIDQILFDECIYNMENTFGVNINHHFICGDFFFKESGIYDYIIGNPPFGGSFNPKLEKQLDKTWGNRMGEKIKKETYSFFILKCVEHHLGSGGTLKFISSDSIITIYTMKGLRKYLSLTGFIQLQNIDYFSEETHYGILTLTYSKDVISFGFNPDHLLYNGKKILYSDIEKTPNFSWNLDSKYSSYFGQQTIEDFMIGSGGLTTGKNEYFIKPIINNTIIEEYSYDFFYDPITVEKETEKAKFNKLGSKKLNTILIKEEAGVTVRNVKIEKVDPITIYIPDERYVYYNKSNSKILYSKPDHIIFWENNGDAIKTFKKNSRWHLQGVGGEEFYFKEGITWQLISDKINAKYLPVGYINDNSAPVLVLKDGVENCELYFILAWLLSSTASEILKNVINHTRNIQAKDLERLPYPFWVELEDKDEIIELTQECLVNLMKGVKVNLEEYLKRVNQVFI